MTAGGINFVHMTIKKLMEVYSHKIAINIGSGVLTRLFKFGNLAAYIKFTDYG